MLDHLLDELSELLDSDSELVRRLYPTAYPGDDEHEAEYQRLMRDELVGSRRRSIETVRAVLVAGRADEEQLGALMQALNSLRLVLGTMLDVSDDPDLPEVDPEREDSAELHLYHYLSWLLEAAVRAGRT